MVYAHLCAPFPAIRGNRRRHRLSNLQVHTLVTREYLFLDNFLHKYIRVEDLLLSFIATNYRAIFWHVQLLRQTITLRLHVCSRRRSANWKGVSQHSLPSAVTQSPPDGKHAPEMANFLHVCFIRSIVAVSRYSGRRGLLFLVLEPSTEEVSTAWSSTEPRFQDSRRKRSITTHDRLVSSPTFLVC